MLQVPKQWLVQDRKTRGGRQETEAWVGMPCRVRLDIYLVVMKGRGEEKKSRGREGERERGEMESTSPRGRQKRERTQAGS